MVAVLTQHRHPMSLTELISVHMAHLTVVVDRSVMVGVIVQRLMHTIQPPALVIVSV